MSPVSRALPAELTIYTAADTHRRCLAWLDDAAAAGVVALDASTVEQADAAGVQLLLSLARTLAARAARLELRAPAAPLVQACRALGAEILLAGAQETT